MEFAKVLDLLKVSRCGNNDGEVLPISSGTVETDVVIRDLTVLNKMDGFETLRGKSSVPIVSVPTCIDYCFTIKFSWQLAVPEKNCVLSGWCGRQIQV